MRSVRVLSLSLCLFAVGCSKNQVAVPTQPTGVDSSQVKAVLMAGSIAEARACRTEVEARGGKVLYQNEHGLLMVDKAAGDLANLTQCQAKVAANETLDIPKSSVGDLPTILRLIPAEEIGARSFVKDNPTADGRGVVIAVLDTGIELDHPMLAVTSTGAPKILDFEDFSMEGRVPMTPVKVESGVFTVDGVTYGAETMAGTDYRFGIFKGSTLKYTSELSKNDKFQDVGVLVYQNAAGETRGRIDTNGNRQFDDEVELYNFKASRKFVKLGEKKSLTTSLTIAPDRAWANLNFDDGSHGTHVAGITAGNEPNGLQGVAPGVQVICGKIGDNRLSGGSTTTASMMLAIDYAVASKASVINMSYGIRSGANLGKSAIDQYVDKVAKASGVIFSISAGNEGPGLLTIGTPAGADLAISNGAYISKRTAQDNYGLAGFEDDGIWYFSSIGPRLDGGWKPTLLAPGSALSSVPMWNTKHGNYRGTSMASPETTGGLALLLSYAQQNKLLTDRASITRAVYDSAVKVPGLSLIEQGHGLFNVPAAVKLLAAMREAPVEYVISATSAASPTGKGAGIYVRAANLPENLTTVMVTPVNGKGLRTMDLVASAPWIKVPESKGFWIEASPKTFQVNLDGTALTNPGIYAEKITAVDPTGAVAFEVPVTVVVPAQLTETSDTFLKHSPIRVGQTLRYFVNVPKGATAIQVDLESDGQVVWGQLLDNEGRKRIDLRDPETTAPMPPLSGSANITRGGVYELDVVAPPTNARPANIQARIRIYSLNVTVQPSSAPGKYDIEIENNFQPLKIVPNVELRAHRRTQTVTVKGDGVVLPVAVSAEDKKTYSAINFTVSTSKMIYDLMTDYPFRVFDPKGELKSAGGMELESQIPIDLADMPEGNVALEITGAFAVTAPSEWNFNLLEERVLDTPVKVFSGGRLLLETSQFRTISVDASKIKDAGDLRACADLVLTDPNGRVIQTQNLCK